MRRGARFLLRPAGTSCPEQPTFGFPVGDIVKWKLPLKKQTAQSGAQLFTRKELAVFTAPMITEQFIIVLAGVLGTRLISGIGESQIAAVSLVNSLNLLPNLIFTALAVGGVAVVSRRLGCGDESGASLAARQLLNLAILVALSMVALFFAGNSIILQLLFPGLSGGTFDMARTYFYVTTLSYPFMAVCSAGAALFHSEGNGNASMLGSLVIYAMTVVATVAAVQWLSGGMTGSGAAVLLGHVSGAVFYLVLLSKRSCRFCLRTRSEKLFDRDTMRCILRIGIPVMIENCIFQVGVLVVNGLISGYGDADLAANGVATSVSNFGTLAGEALSLVIVTVVGRCLGAGDEKAVRSYTKKLLIITYGIMLVINGALLLSVRSIVSGMNVSADIFEPTVQILQIFFSSCVLAWPLAFVLPNALRAAGDAKFTLCASTVSMWIVRVGGGYLLGTALGLGIRGIWLAMALDWFVRGIVNLLRFRSKRWLKELSKT